MKSSILLEINKDEKEVLYDALKTYQDYLNEMLKNPNPNAIIGKSRIKKVLEIAYDLFNEIENI